MPNITNFKNHTESYAKDVMRLIAIEMRKTAEFGKEFMQDAISNSSPTGTKWHDAKNAINGYGKSRVGSSVNKKVNGVNVHRDPHAGQMLNAVEAGELKLGGTKVQINYGWVNTQAQYFLDQDTGNYAATAMGSPSGVGMGLLNERGGAGKGVLGKYRAKYATEYFLIKNMQELGFDVVDEGGLF